jgi:hypothetical protein
MALPERFSSLKSIVSTGFHLRQNLLLIPMVFILNCGYKKAKLTDNVWNYQKVEIQHNCEGCREIITKDIEFYIKHEDYLDLSKNNIGLSLKGSIYSSNYNYPILIEDICWCLDTSLNV